MLVNNNKNEIIIIIKLLLLLTITNLSVVLQSKPYLGRLILRFRDHT